LIKRSDDLSLPNDRKAFRDRLINRMKEQRITGAELARAAKLSKDAISTYTTMRSLPTPKTLARLAQVLQCKPHDLLPDKPANESLLEMREHAKPGYKILVVRMALPVSEALHYYGALAKLEEKVGKRLATQAPPASVE
jgi:transcriptional regulator with XRE-family HTH domain